MTIMDFNKGEIRDMTPEEETAFQERKKQFESLLAPDVQTQLRKLREDLDKGMKILKNLEKLIKGGVNNG